MRDAAITCSYLFLTALVLVLLCGTSVAEGDNPRPDRFHDIEGVWTVDREAWRELINGPDPGPAQRAWSLEWHPVFDDWFEIKLDEVTDVTEGEGWQRIETITYRYEGRYHLNLAYFSRLLSRSDYPLCFFTELDFPMTGSVAYRLWDEEQLDGTTFEVEARFRIDIDEGVPSVELPLFSLNGWYGDGPEPRGGIDRDCLFCSADGRSISMQLDTVGPIIPLADAGHIAVWYPECTDDNFDRGYWEYGGIHDGINAEDILYVKHQPQYWRLQERGAITGRLIELSPDGLDRRGPIPNATVTIYQQLRELRDRRPDEDEVAYMAYIRSQTRQLDRFSIRDVTDGSFEFTDLPGWHMVRGPMNYTIEVSNAWLDEMNQDTNQVESVLFAESVLTNRRVGDAPEIGLVPFNGLAAKERVAFALGGISPNNYREAEIPVLRHLDQLRNNPANHETWTNEALNRAHWAEQVVNVAAANAEVTIEVMLDGLAAFIRQAVDKVLSKDHRRIARDKSRLRSRQGMWDREQMRAGGWTRMSGDATPEAMRIDDSIDRLYSANTALMVSEIARVSKSAIKLVAAGMHRALVMVGVSNENAGGFATAFKKTGYVLADIAIHQGVIGGSKEAIRSAIEWAVRQGTDELFDGQVSYSFCAMTTEYIELSTEFMLGWRNVDRNAYERDRAATVWHIGHMADEAGTVVDAALRARAVGDAFEQIEAILDVVGTISPHARAGKWIAKFLKFASLAASFIIPARQVYWMLPDQIAEGVCQAYGREATDCMSGAQKSDLVTTGFPLSAALLDELTASATALDTAIAAVDGYLRTDEILGAILASGADEDSLVTALTRFRTAVSAASLQAIGSVEVGDGDPVPIHEVLIAEAILAEVTFDTLDALKELYFSVLLEEFENAADPEYQGVRAAVVSELVAMRAHTTALVDLLLDLEITQTLPVAVVTDISVSSDSTGLAVITETPETFTVRAQVRNFGDAPVSEITALLLANTEDETLAIVDSVEQSVAGGQLEGEAEVTWQVRYDGDLSYEAMFISVELLEDGESPASWVTIPERRQFGVDVEIADADLDGIPDDYEDENGLDSSVDDYDTDTDGDGLTNAQELRLGTAPNDDDSDDDGSSDFEELFFGDDGFITDPLNPDSDEDGTLDGEDSAPLDGTDSPAPDDLAVGPGISVDQTEIVLDGELSVVTVGVEAADGVAWAAFSDNDSLVNVSPSEDDLRIGNGNLIVSLAPDFDFELSGTAQTTVWVVGLGDSPDNYAEVLVRVEGEWEAPEPVVGGSSGSDDLDGSATGGGSDGCCRMVPLRSGLWAFCCFLVPAAVWFWRRRSRLCR